MPSDTQMGKVERSQATGFSTKADLMRRCETAGGT